MRNQVALDGSQMVEHGPVQDVAMSGTARRLAEDAPVIGQLEEKVAAALERLDQRGIFAQANQREVEHDVGFVEGGDVGSAPLVEDVADAEQVVAVPVFGG